MERIVIEVADATAKKWKSSTPKLREAIAQKIDIRIAKELMVDSKEEFKQFLDEIGTTMQQLGLTEEILNDILKENE